jgi:hypothetical protein
MIDAPINLKNLLNQSVSVTAVPMCEIEHNMNSLIDGVTVVSTSTTEDYTSGIAEWSNTKSNPFKKLFPIDSIVQPMRPMYPGTKYFIMGGTNVTDTPVNSFLPFRTLNYTGEGKDFNIVGAKPRIYYPGISTEYKYWLSPLNKNINLTVQYLQTQQTWTDAGKTGSIPAGNKAALANKIVIKFEKFHAIPTNYKVTITKSDNTTAVVGPLTTTSTESGVIYITLEGGSWTKRDGATALPPSLVLDSPILIKSIKLEATNPGGGKYLGVIEVSARWVSYISNDIVDLDINKEASNSSEDILPVGLITANTLTMNLNRFNQSSLKVKGYTNDITSFDQGTIYLTKNSELRPAFKVIHSGGALTVDGETCDIIPQGVFYIESWGISQYGEAQITALDGSKYLMETIAPNLLCQGAPVVAILRNLLDSVGFTNYKFNMTSGDKSIPFIHSWWTEDTQTVWDEIQSLCRDFQMSAFFDENNILQFYSRDYLYSQTNAVHTFYQNQSGLNLPNIVSFNKREIPSVNSVQVKWRSPVTSSFRNNSSQSPTVETSLLSAGALKNPTERPDGPALNLTDTYFVIDQTALDPYGETQSFYNYNSFVIIESEIIEYDAIGYDYTPLDGPDTARESVWLESATEYSKYLTLSKSGFQDPNKPETAFFKPNGKYRIKTRGALGTVPAVHSTATSNLSGDSKWKGAVVSFGARQNVTNANDGNYPAYNFTTNMQVVDYPEPNEINVEAITSAPGIKLTVQELNDNFTPVGSPVVDNYVAGHLSYFAGMILTLEIGKLYRISFQPKNSSGTQRGNTQTIVHRMIENKFNGSPTSNPTDPTKITAVNKSYLKLNADKLNADQYALAYREFNSLNVPPSTSTSSSYPVTFIGDYFQSYAGEHYYSFGTSVFLDKSSINPKQSAGLGFFINDIGARGYFIIVEALKSSATANRKSVRIIKAHPRGTKVLKDSQVTIPNPLDAIYAGISYNIDVKVKLSGERVDITAYINGNKITAVDTNSADLVKDANWILGPTKNVGLMSLSGSSTFDYVYASTIDKERYDSSSYVTNIYQGQFSNDILNTAYGDMIYNSNIDQDEISQYKVKDVLDEFGPVVRELAYRKIRLPRPSFPITWSTGVNKLVTVVGSKLSSFEAEAYILNNTSVTVPLSDTRTNSLTVVGNQLGKGGDLIYSTDDTSDYTAKEPIIFDSTWIQSEADAKTLAEWIKEKIMNKGRVVRMSVFGNPLITIGDIVSISNSYQGFDGTEKLIVTNVSQRFNQGLETEIVCRTL